jgi:hypothetical protein
MATETITFKNEDGETLAARLRALCPVLHLCERLACGACSYCANAFGATESVKEAGVPLLDEYEGHPSVQNLIDEGYQVLTL